MSDFPINAPVDNSPLAGADEVIVRRQGAPAATRAPASSMPVSAAVAQALDAVASNAATDATTKANAARDAAVGTAAADATSKANAAQAAAVAAAAMDATTKANSARDSANQTAANTYLPLTARGAAQGVAELVNGLIQSNRLPSFVDDVLEFANLAAFPPTGETGKIYIAINGATPSDPTKQYRWSGSAYSEITGSPGSTDAVAEGSMNLYFTQERVNLTQITGLVFTTLTAIANGDTLRVMLGKIQAQLNNAANVVRGTVLTGINTTADGEIIETTTVLQAIGRLVARVAARLGRRLADGTDVSFGQVGDGQILRRSGTQLIGEDSISGVSYTLAERPPAAGNADETIRVKGVGNVRSVWQESNGTDWGLQNGQATIIRDVPAAAPVTTAPGSDTSLGISYTIPGGLINLQSEIRIWPTFLSLTADSVASPANSTSNVVAVLVGGLEVYRSAAGAWYQHGALIRLQMQNSRTVARAFGLGLTGTGLGNSNSAAFDQNNSLRTIDFTIDQTITFLVRGAATNTMKLDSITVEVIDR